MPDFEDKKGKETKETRNQHWLPASYLQFFTAEQKREGYLYRVDKAGHNWAKAETQGVGPYHYRREQTQQSEALFRVSESNYPKLIRKAIAGKILSLQEQCSIILDIVMLSCRNPFLENQTDQNNWNTFVSTSSSFFENHLGAPPYDEAKHLSTELEVTAKQIIQAQDIRPLPLDRMPSVKEIVPQAHALRFVASVFQVIFIKELSDSLYSCDYPTIFFTLDQKTTPLMLLPVTPSLLAVAYDTRFFEIKHYWLTGKDLQLIQEFLLAQTDKAFFVGATEEVNLHSLSESLRTRKHRSKGWIKKDIWQPIVYSYPSLFRAKGGFDFLVLRE